MLVSSVLVWVVHALEASDGSRPLQILVLKISFDGLRTLRYFGVRNQRTMRTLVGVVGRLPRQSSCTTSKSSAVSPWKAGLSTPLSHRASIVPVTYMSEPLSATMRP